MYIYILTYKQILSTSRRCRDQQIWQPPWDQRKPCAEWKFSLTLPVTAETRKHGAHHETKESHLLREQFSLVLPAEVGKMKMTTFDLWPTPWGGGAWGAGTNMWHPETPASYESLPAPLATQIPTLWVHTSGKGGRGGALILDRCRAFDLFASVDAHLWTRDQQTWRPTLDQSKPSAAWTV